MEKEWEREACVVERVPRVCKRVRFDLRSVRSSVLSDDDDDEGVVRAVLVLGESTPL